VLNYRHLYYFWIVTKEGGFSRAADRLDMAVQTISAQVRELERSFGHQLLKPAGRGVALTEAGKAAFSRAEEIFQLGQRLPEEVKQASSAKVTRLKVGFSDGISKLAAHALLAPVLQMPDLRLVCHEGELDELMGELALHQLDLVLSCRPAPYNPNLRLISQRLSDAAVIWFGPSKMVGSAERARFPQSLDALPVLLPTAHSAFRDTLDRWFDTHGLKPNVVGEFEDSALLAVFASGGMGVFPVSTLGAAPAKLMRGLRWLGSSADLREEIYLLRSRRGLEHPAALRIVDAAQKGGAAPGFNGT